MAAAAAQSAESSATSGVARQRCLQGHSAVLARHMHTGLTTSSAQVDALFMLKVISVKHKVDAAHAHVSTNNDLDKKSLDICVREKTHARGDDAKLHEAQQPSSRAIAEFPSTV